MVDHELVSMSSAKCETLRAFADIARAMGHEHRLELLNLIAQGERPVERLSEISGLSIANTSQHLQHLKRAGLVDTRRDGRHVMYRLADDSVIELIVALQRAGERTSDQLKVIVGEYFTRQDCQDAVRAEELAQRMNDGGAWVLDVRPGDEFSLGHLPGAVNIPFGELEARLPELPRDREIVAYCRGPYCVVSFETVALLRVHGFSVHRLNGGFPNWKAAGLPYEMGA